MFYFFDDKKQVVFQKRCKGIPARASRFARRCNNGRVESHIVWIGMSETLSESPMVIRIKGSRRAKNGGSSRGSPSSLR